MTFLNNYIYTYKETLFKIIKDTDDNKVIVYLVFFSIFLINYYLIMIPQMTKDIKNNELFTKINDFSKKRWFIILICIINIIILFSLIILFITFFKRKNSISKKNILNMILISIGIISIVLYFDILIFSDKLLIISNSSITKYIFITLSSLFYVLYFILFVYNLGNKYNVEFYLSIEILILFMIQYIILSVTNIKKVYYQLKHDDFSILTINCFKKNIK
jgi:hypothetical protein